MADSGIAPGIEGHWTPPASIDEARARARERFKSRLATGQEVGGCGCEEGDEVVGAHDDTPSACVVGARFRDSGRLYYFRSDPNEAQVGDWVVVRTARGEEAARVVLAPHQVRQSTIQGDLGRVIRGLEDAEVGQMAAQKRKSADAVKLFGERARSRRLGVKIIAADFSFDGASVTLSYSVPDREQGPDAAALRELARGLAAELDSRVELRQVGPRDEARLLGGLGRCGRTLCCSSWLPVFPEISMSMAKNQELPLNPSKVSGVCGRLLCCLSYENEQYRQMKSVMPKLGQTIETPGGMGQVVSLHLLKELVTVRLEEENTDVVFRSEELGLGTGRPLVQLDASPVVNASETILVDVPAASLDSQDSAEPPSAAGKRRRRRRGSRKAGGA